MNALAGSLARNVVTATRKCPSGDAGESVSISGSVALIGAWNADNYQGAVCVYTRSRRGWRLTSVLKDPGGKKWDGFGYKVAVSSTGAGTYAVVSGSGDGESPGLTYIYLRSGGTWRIAARLTDPTKALDDFGQSVALSGTTAVVGADDAKKGAGLLYVYVKSGSGWRLQATLGNPTRTPNFGSDLSISGGTLMVGDQEQPSPSTRSRPSTAGRPAATSVFVRSGSRWHVQAELTTSTPAAVSIVGNMALIGQEAPGNAVIFARTGRHWRRLSLLRGPFGNSVAIAGHAAVIGGPYADGGCGAAYVYEGSGKRWRLRVKLVPPKCPKNTLELFGWSVAAAGNTAVIGGGYGGAFVMHFP
ncbi:MAG: hypothetical protein ACRDRJ_23965 [Streptosporangiaceae bacterium]